LLSVICSPDSISSVGLQTLLPGGQDHYHGRGIENRKVYYQVECLHGANFTANQVEEKEPEVTQVATATSTMLTSMQFTMLLDMVKGLHLEILGDAAGPS